MSTFIEDEDNQDKKATIIPVKVSVSDEFVKEMGDEYSRQMQKLAPQDFYDIEVDGKAISFTRRKILSKERRELESIRQKLADAAKINSPKYPGIEDQLYKKMASMYLIDPSTQKGMTDNQFDSTVFEDIKNILNACAFRTERPIPSPFETTK